MSRYNDSIRAAIYSLAGIMILLLLAMLASCKTRYVTVPEYHKEYIHSTDTFICHDVQRDTSWMTIREVDSVELRRLGIIINGLNHALLVERYNNRERQNNNQRIKTDTIMKSDSIRVPYPVERRLNKWEQFKMEVGGWAIGIASAALFALVVYVVMWIVRTRRKV